MMIHRPEVLGDTHAERIESLNRIAAAGLHLMIPPPDQRGTPDVTLGHRCASDRLSVGSGVSRHDAAPVEQDAASQTATFVIQPLDEHQARALLDAVARHRLEPLYRVALSLGLRRGEVLGCAGRTSTWSARRSASLARSSVCAAGWGAPRRRSRRARDPWICRPCYLPPSNATARRRSGSARRRATAVGLGFLSQLRKDWNQSGVLIS